MSAQLQTGRTAALNALAALDPASEAAQSLSWLLLQNEELTLRVIELSDEAEQARTAANRAEVALMLIRDAMSMLGVIADREVRLDKPELFARDFAPFVNIMAAHGVKPDGKPSLKKAGPK